MALRRFDDEGTPSHDQGDSPIGEEDARKILQPLVKMALDAAITQLVEAGRAAMQEEKTQGQPGEKWDEFLELISQHTHIPKDDRLRQVLVARLIFLFIAAKSMLPPGTDIDPGKIVLD